MEFKDQVKAARLQIGLSQVALAKELGVSFPIINRWKNGHGEPHNLVKNAFYELCRKNGIKLVQ